jgi:hypothetical protein
MRNRTKWVGAVVVAVLVGLGLGSVAQAQESEWEWVVTPYLFLPAIDGDSTIAGQTVPIDMSFGDIWDNFDALSLALRTEGWKGDWGFILEGLWTDLDGSFGPGDAINVKIQQWYIDALGGWRKQSPAGTAMPIHWDVTGGLRLNSFKQEVGLPAGTIGGREDWVDLMVGSRGVWKIADSWIGVLRGDIGGFGISDSADMSASVTGGFGWLFNPQWSLDFGYRYYVLDYETDRSDGTFGFDGSESGLWLGLTWKQL